jgi:folylpolyglutamate synthase/dihydropteroate synthase
LAAGRTTGSDLEASIDAMSAVERALQLTPVHGLVVVTGSVFLVGQVRPLLVGTQALSTEPQRV